MEDTEARKKASEPGGSRKRVAPRLGRPGKACLEVGFHYNCYGEPWEGSTKSARKHSPGQKWTVVPLVLDKMLHFNFFFFACV